MPVCMRLDVDAVIVATSTPDQAFPAVGGARAGGASGMVRGFAFDVSAACSGFVYALAVADGFIRTGVARAVLVIGSEVYSRILELERTGQPACCLAMARVQCCCRRARRTGRGCLSTHLHSDGRLGEILYVDGAVGTAGSARAPWSCAGRMCFARRWSSWPRAVDEALAANGLVPCRCGLAGAAPGQQADYTRRWASGWDLAARARCDDGGAARQYVGGIHSAGDGRGGGGWAHSSAGIWC